MANKQWSKTILSKAYAINEKRLLGAESKFKELQTAISFLREKAKHKLLIGQELAWLYLLNLPYTNLNNY